MVVVAIIGILAAIAIPNFMSSRNRAYEASLRANMHTVQLCTEDFAALAEGFYPGNLDTRIGDVLSSLGYEIDAGWENKPPFYNSIADGRRKPPFTSRALLQPHAGFCNPFMRADVAIDNIAGPPAVPPSGCTYYTGFDETGPKLSGGVAEAYSICGYGRKAPIVLVLSSGR
jgi:type II secretory pathway pseudopilin PulG